MMQLDFLLQPLATSAGRCGTDLIFSSEFDAIRDARRFDDPSLAQGEWVTQVKEAEWDRVIRNCEDILINKSKDLRVAAWLTEARGKTAGLAGLGDGYQLLVGLCETFWEDIHPQIDDGELDQRIGTLNWLLNQTTQLIRHTPLTLSSKGKFSLIDQESARTNARNIERNPELAVEYQASTSVTLESFDSAVRDTPPRHFSECMAAAEKLKATLTALQAILDQRLGEHAPAFGPAFDALDDTLRFIRKNGGESTKANGAAIATPLPGGPNAVLPEPLPLTVHSGAPQSREQAIRQLQDIAAFFRRSEPHSPVAYLADKAARWGSMPLHEWLRTVVKDDAALSRMEELLGVERLRAEADEN